jgi:pyridoxal/pyridoxine/pyridoxamine kinase
MEVCAHSRMAMAPSRPRAQGEGMLRLVQGLEANGFLPLYTHLLSGYVGTVSFLQQLVALVRKIKAASPGVFYGSARPRRVLGA